MASSGNAWGEETNRAWRKSSAWGPFDVPPSHSAFEQRSAEEEEPAAPREDPAFEVRPETGLLSEPPRKFLSLSFWLG